MHNKLAPIFRKKQQEVAELYRMLEHDAQHPLHAYLQLAISHSPAVSFTTALQSEKLAIIAEIKRKSPSKGMLASIPDPITLAQRYITGGASALSILTDQDFFAGHIHDLAQVAAAIAKRPIPILRKDFIIDKIQIAEAALAGASAILCIIALVKNDARELINFAKQLNLAVLVEVHDREEIDIALACGAEIIGVNNRNLNTFAVDTHHALQVLPHIPAHIIKIAESGITSSDLAKQYHDAGFDAVLIGEALVKTDQPEQFIRACRDE